MKETGLVDGKLRPCPSTPNCVCSQERDPGHRVVPWSYAGDGDAIRERLIAALKTFPRMELLTEEPRYLHAAFKSAIFGWVDDLELLIDEETKLVHVRSASRAGRWDLGVNKRRVLALRRVFEASP
jgi:uncharacterized protein (DUF1499 family)